MLCNGVKGTERNEMGFTVYNILYYVLETYTRGCILFLYTGINQVSNTEHERTPNTRKDLQNLGKIQNTKQEEREREREKDVREGREKEKNGTRHGFRVVLLPIANIGSSSACLCLVFCVLCLACIVGLN